MAELDTRSPERELSWILPLYRTTSHLEELLTRIRRTASSMGVTHEIVLVDDACPDGGGEFAERIIAGLPAARVVRLAHNHGQDGALRAGLRVCRGRWAVLIDADLQDPPEAVAELWTRRAGADAVLANRVGRYTSPGRHVTSWFYRRVASLISGLPQGACLFALINRGLIDHIAATKSNSISILAAIAGAGGTYVITPVTRSARPSGASAYSPSRRLDKALHSLWQMLLSRRLGVSL